MAGASQTRGHWRRTETTSQRILDAARAVIARRGISGLRIREVAAEAGVNVAAIHYHFGSKELLMEAVLQSIGDRFYQDYLALPGSGAGRIRAHFRTTVDYLAEQDDLHRVWLNFLVESFHSPRIQALFHRLLERWRHCYQSDLEASYRSGHPLPLPPERLTPLLMSITEGAVVQALADPGRFEPLAYFGDAEKALLFPDFKEDKQTTD